MDEYWDETCLMGLCALLLAVPANDSLAIAGFLAALIMACASTAHAPLRRAVQAAFIVCACTLTAFWMFLPVAVYCLMHDRSWVMRLLWLVPLAVHLCLAGLTLICLQETALCAVACVLAIRDNRMTSEHRGLVRAYDGLRERMMTQSSTSTAQAAEAHEPALFENLTQREIAVAQLVAEGMDNREIAQRLFLSEGTVRNHISAILQKKDLTNRTQIAIQYHTT